MIIDTKKPREKWFDPPKISEKLEKKVLSLPENTNTHKVVEAVLNLGAQEALVIPQSYHIFPERLFKGTRETEFFDQPDFKRYGNDLNLPVSPSIEEAVAKRLNPMALLKKEINGIGVEDCYRGYGWRGISKQRTTHKVVPPTSLLDGYALYVLFEKIHDQKLEKMRPEGKGGMYAQPYGQSCIVSVPSRRKPGYRHVVVFEMLPLKKGGDNSFYAEWTETRASEKGPEDKRYRELGQRRVVPEIVFNDPDVAAFAKIVDVYSEGQTHVALNPFAVPTPMAVLFDDNLQNKVVLERGNRHRNLTEAERDILFFKLCGYCNMRAPLYDDVPAYGSVLKGTTRNIENYMVKIR